MSAYSTIAGGWDLLGVCVQYNSWLTGALLLRPSLSRTVQQHLCVPTGTSTSTYSAAVVLHTCSCVRAVCTVCLSVVIVSARYGIVYVGTVMCVCVCQCGVRDCCCIACRQTYRQALTAVRRSKTPMCLHSWANDYLTQTSAVVTVSLSTYMCCDPIHRCTAVYLLMRNYVRTQNSSQ